MIPMLRKVASYAFFSSVERFVFWTFAYSFIRVIDIVRFAKEFVFYTNTVFLSPLGSFRARNTTHFIIGEDREITLTSYTCSFLGIIISYSITKLTLIQIVIPMFRKIACHTFLTIIKWSLSRTFTNTLISIINVIRFT